MTQLMIWTLRKDMNSLLSVAKKKRKKSQEYVKT